MRTLTSAKDLWQEKENVLPNEVAEVLFDGLDVDCERTLDAKHLVEWKMLDEATVIKWVEEF